MKTVDIIVAISSHLPGAAQSAEAARRGRQAIGSCKDVGAPGA